VLSVVGTQAVPLPNDQVLSADISVDVADTVFTVATAGTYRIAYYVNLTAALLMGTEVLVNSTAVPESVIDPVVSVSSFQTEFQVTLTAGSTVELALFSPLLGAATLLGGGAGASLSIIRLF
jgi:hypothetical protein